MDARVAQDTRQAAEATQWGPSNREGCFAPLVMAAGGDEGGLPLEGFARWTRSAHSYVLGAASLCHTPQPLGTHTPPESREQNQRELDKGPSKCRGPCPTVEGLGEHWLINDTELLLLQKPGPGDQRSHGPERLINLTPDYLSWAPESKSCQFQLLTLTPFSLFPSCPALCHCPSQATSPPSSATASAPSASLPYPSSMLTRSELPET